MQFTVATIAAAFLASVAAATNGTTSAVWVTDVVTAFTTVCPEATVLTYGASTYTVTTSTTLTITNCPCTISKLASVTPVVSVVPVYANSTSPAVVVPAGTTSSAVVVPAGATSSAVVVPAASTTAAVGTTSATTTKPATFTGAANRAAAGSAAGLAGLLGLAAYIL